MWQKIRKVLLILLVTAATLLLVSPVAFSAEVLPTAGDSYPKALFALAAMIGAALSIGVAGCGVGIGMGAAINGATGAVGRNPGAQAKIMMTMIIGLAMAESVAIYGLVISMILIYANPFMSYFLG
ncbi:MAG: ATP synthase F0 subunit C [Proteobacteria bacterium]|nr:ATP synthase F0 subunit C [Pseudomonadota bacterium]